ncbi:hypothetical protein LBMAG53_27500 [Planctomycetota bacterium]|nr:hypothetical protein LBMAG53_27500 [Planctomycetota bacterium]
MSDFTVILRETPPPCRDSVAAFLGKAFSLKESTCASIAHSAPIVLLTGLTIEEAAACSLSLSGLSRAGATVDFVNSFPADLPKIDWPRRPQLFKRDLAEHIADLLLPVQGLAPGTTLLSLMVARVGGSAPATGRFAAPIPGVPVAGPAAAPPPGRPSQEFRGIQLPEITPFSTPMLPPTATPPPTPAVGDTVSRLNELFPDEGGGFVPNNSDITSLLDRLLPDEHAGEPSTTTPNPIEVNRGAPHRVGMNQAPAASSPGFAVFLAKITDEARRLKAVPLIAELGKISTDEADALSKKVIIPVMKGASKDEAEAAKQKFAKIGIIARVKGPE